MLEPNRSSNPSGQGDGILKRLLNMATGKLDNLIIRFDTLPVREQIAVGLRFAVVLVCFVSLCMFTAELVMAQQYNQLPRIPASNLKDEDQDSLIAENQTEIKSVAQALLDLRAERDKRHAEALAERALIADSLKESRERQARDEGVCLGAFTMIGILQALILFIKKPAGK